MLKIVVVFFVFSAFRKFFAFHCCNFSAANCYGNAANQAFSPALFRLQLSIHPVKRCPRRLVGGKGRNINETLRNGRYPNRLQDIGKV